MKKIVIYKTGDSSVMSYESMLMTKLEADEVCIKMTATAVNYIDTLIRSGNIPEAMMPEFPFTPGVECIGVVTAVGNEVTDFTTGDKVAYFGKIGASTYAESVVVKEQQLVLISQDLDDTVAAVIPVNYGTAYHMLHNLAMVAKGDIIFVHAAAGGVGTALIQLAKLAGAIVIGSVSSEAKKDYILAEGVDYAINYKTENIVDRVNEITKGKGVQVSLNPVSGQSMITDLDILSPFGHLIIFGFIAGLPENSLQEAMLNHFGKSLTVSYSDIYTLYNHNHKKLKEVLKTLFGLLAESKIAPRVFKTLPLAEATSAHDFLESGKVTGKLILVP